MWAIFDFFFIVFKWFLSDCNFLAYQHIYGAYVDIIILHVKIFILHVDINLIEKKPLEHNGQKYATKHYRKVHSLTRSPASQASQASLQVRELVELISDNRTHVSRCKMNYFPLHIFKLNWKVKVTHVFQYEARREASTRNRSQSCRLFIVRIIR